MAVTLTARKVSLSGLAGASLVAAADSTGFVFANDGRVYLRISNANAATITATATAGKKCSQNVLHSVSVVVGAVGSAPANVSHIGPFAKDEFDDANGNVTVGLSLGAGTAGNVTAELVQVPDYGR